MLCIGISYYFLIDLYILVENNYFEYINGEVEIIFIKLGKNIFRNNVFFEVRGIFIMWYGNGNFIEDNVFIGNNVLYIGGICVINCD